MKNRIELRDAAAPELIIGGSPHCFDKPANSAEYRAGGYPSGLNEAAVPAGFYYSLVSSNNAEFTSDQTHGFSRAGFTDVAVSSEGLGWTSAFVSRQRENPYQGSFAACANPLIGFVLNGPLSIRRTVNGVPQERKFTPGSFGIVPAGAAFDARIDTPIETIHIYIRQEIIEEVASDFSPGDPAKLKLIPQFSAFDQLLEQLAVGLCEAAREADPSSSLYADHLARTFAARLVKKHSTAACHAASSTDGLSQRQLDRVLELIETNLAAPLSLADMARDSRLSPNHFARLFKRSTGFTPYQYLMRRRIDRAQRLLAEKNISITDIAVECGFGNQMHLTRAFAPLVGTTPASYRRMRRS